MCSKLENTPAKEQEEKIKAMEHDMSDASQAMETGAQDAYQKIESAVVGGYRKIEDGVVGGFNKMTDKIVETLFAREGETAEQARKRLEDNAKKHRS